jgi:S-ribosylhomocysteine lyase LuxS involved in autoinducer biosynthesis
VLWLPKRDGSEEERESKRSMIHKEEESQFLVKKRICDEMVKKLNQIPSIKHKECGKKNNVVLPSANEEKKMTYKKNRNTEEKMEIDKKKI